MKILNKINNPKELKKINPKELILLAEEIREKIISTTAKTGGHIAPSLGVVELAIALHYCFNTPKDKIVWDVGHQSYAHKILTERKEKFSLLRQLKGISGFPKRDESIYDAFGTGHSSTSISAALGLATARSLNKKDYKVVAVIGDGGLTGGLAFEGLNNAGHLKEDILIILNDNSMFISKKVGAIGEYLTKILTCEPLHKIEDRVKNILERHPHWGKELIRLAKRSKVMLTPGMFFEELGFDYFGPIDGHDINGLIDNIEKIKNMKGAKFLHVITKKGKGYELAENNVEQFHGIGPFEIKNGQGLSIKNKPNYQDVFGDAMIELARMDKKIVAITAAMASGTGLNKFSKNFPKRFFDVGIAEQHAVTFAAGLAAEGVKPVCAIYSTFLQRAYDQIIHDVALQELPVIFAIDRAGIVGEDGPTHHGIFDLSYFASVPNMVVTAAADGKELRNLLYSATKWAKPVSIRYPRGEITGENYSEKFTKIELGKAELLKKGKDLVIMAIGSMVETAVSAAALLEKEGIDAGVINLRFAKPLDTKLILEEAKSCGNVITVEENTIEGGVGERIARIIPESVKVEIIAIDDIFIPHGTIKELKKQVGLSVENIVKKAKILL